MSFDEAREGGNISELNPPPDLTGYDAAPSGNELPSSVRYMPKMKNFHRHTKILEKGG
jgi:hypothetical protein